jgi:uncharacterized protein
MHRIILICLASLYLTTGCAQSGNYLKENYIKMDTLIPMRDGVKLYTVIFIPKDSNGTKYPILMERTPYSAAPYGNKSYPGSTGPNAALMKEHYIFVVQDVRGRYMSEGINLEVTPYIADKKNNKDVDESSDTYDTVDWLLKNIQRNNGRVGLHGISYPGFYATACLPGVHPAIKAVSPQAPVTDEFIGDDANHNGAFFLLDNFSFMNYFGKERKGPVKDYGSNVFNVQYNDAYRFFLKMGPVKNSNGPQYYNGKSYIWNEYLQHDTYDAYWKARNIRQHLKNISIPTLVVGGWFDAENLFGALRTYEAIATQSPNNQVQLVMGPWTHGAWASGEWAKFGTHDFGSNTSKFFQDSLETIFFNYHLKDKGHFIENKATMFQTGANEWKRFAAWPPIDAKPTPYYFDQDGKLSSTAPTNKLGANNSFTEYISDPQKPVPYTNGVFRGRNNEYMVEDQRFTASRPDVLVFETEELKEDMTIGGNIMANLLVSTTGTDADFIVKLIDVLPSNEPSSKTPIRGYPMAGFQRLVRAEVIRGKFRNSFEKPEPFVPGKVTKVKLQLNDALHTFKKGHKIMVQVQSSWFPLVDRNPQKFMRIPEATEKDFQRATIRLYHDAKNSSSIVLPVLK